MQSLCEKARLTNLLCERRLNSLTFSRYANKHSNPRAIKINVTHTCDSLAACTKISGSHLAHKTVCVYVECMPFLRRKKFPRESFSFLGKFAPLLHVHRVDERVERASGIRAPRLTQVEEHLAGERENRSIDSCTRMTFKRNTQIFPPC
jgi:hypothetical protein